MEARPDIAGMAGRSEVVRAVIGLVMVEVMDLEFYVATTTATAHAISFDDRALQDACELRTVWERGRASAPCGIQRSDVFATKQLAVPVPEHPQVRATLIPRWTFPEADADDMNASHVPPSISRGRPHRGHRGNCFSAPATAWHLRQRGARSRELGTMTSGALGRGQWSIGVQPVVGGAARPVSPRMMMAMQVAAGSTVIIDRYERMATRACAGDRASRRDAGSDARPHSSSPRPSSLRPCPRFSRARSASDSPGCQC